MCPRTSDCRVVQVVLRVQTRRPTGIRMGAGDLPRRAGTPSTDTGRAVPDKNGKQITPKDFMSSRSHLRKGLVGAKPERVCRWILDLLNVQPGDNGGRPCFQARGHSLGRGRTRKVTAQRGSYVFCELTDAVLQFRSRRRADWFA